MSEDKEFLEKLYTTQRELFLRTLLAIDEQLDNDKPEKARYIVEQTYILLTQYPINQEKRNDK